MQSRDQTVSHSVTLLIEKLKATDAAEFHDAAAKIWQRYAVDLLTMARRRLERAGIRHREDEEDVLQSVYRVLASGDTPAKYKNLRNREDLWKLLLTITNRRISNKVNRHYSAGRNPAAEARSNADNETSALDGAADHAPSPEQDVLSAIEVGRLLAMLDETARKVAMWKLEGFTNEEIAANDKLDCTVRTVERKLQLIRDIWEEADGEE